MGVDRQSLAACASRTSEGELSVDPGQDRPSVSAGSPAYPGQKAQPLPPQVASISPALAAQISS
jgi:hypothetical protein